MNEIRMVTIVFAAFSWLACLWAAIVLRRVSNEHAWTRRSATYYARGLHLCAWSQWAVAWGLTGLVLGLTGENLALSVILAHLGLWGTYVGLLIIVAGIAGPHRRRGRLWDAWRATWKALVEEWRALLGSLRS